MAKKRTYPFDLDKFKQFRGQLYDLETRALDGQIDFDQASQLLQVVLTDQFDSIKFVDPFARYARFLLPLDKQLELLVEYNEEYWGNVFSKGELEAVNTDSDHTQRFEDLEILHVAFGSPEKTFEGGAKLIEGTQPRYWRWDNLKSNPDHLRLLAGNTRQYKPGIHRVHINLAAHWEPKNGRTLVEVQNQAKESGEMLAHSEVLSAYGLHVDLLQQMDGTNLPYADLPGYEVKPSGNGEWRDSPYLRWFAGDRGAFLSAGSVDDRDQNYAAPVVWESSR